MAGDTGVISTGLTAAADGVAEAAEAEGYTTLTGVTPGWPAKAVAGMAAPSTTTPVDGVAGDTMMVGESVAGVDAVGGEAEAELEAEECCLLSSSMARTNSASMKPSSDCSALSTYKLAAVTW